MLSEADIQRALHAARVVPLDVANPNGPLGLEWLAGAVAQARGEEIPQRVRRPIAHAGRASRPGARQPSTGSIGLPPPHQALHPTPSERSGEHSSGNGSDHANPAWASRLCRHSSLSSCSSLGVPFESIVVRCLYRCFAEVAQRDQSGHGS